MKRFKLQSGHVVTVDDQDAYMLRSKVWLAQTTPKGDIFITERGRRGGDYMLSHKLTDAPSGAYVRHLDGDPLNCQRANLRVVSREEFYRQLALEKRLLARLLHA